jgi:GH24 family phage-related lysozyme (muramidase)
VYIYPTHTRSNQPTFGVRAPLSPDPAGVPHIGNGQGQQFITGQCLSNADCGSGCCATLGNIGICSGPDVANVSGKSGCGFGGGGAPAPAADPAPAASPAPAAAAVSSGGSGLHPDPAGVPHIGNGQGQQFITGQCLSNADCGSGCCATLGNIGICSGPDVANVSGKSGCGFGGGGAPAPAPAPAADPAPPAPAAAAAASSSSGGSGLHPDPAGVPHIGNGQGQQFITGQCLSNADCGSGCCATLGNIGICSGPDVGNVSGKTGCGFGS